MLDVREAGFYMPAEWTLHRRCWMAWPYRPALWGGRLKKAQANYAAVAQAIARFEPVVMVVDPKAAADARLQLGPDIEVVEIPIDDSWARDSGPNFLVDSKGNLGGSTWRFNSWGGNYPKWDEDDRLGARILDRAGARHFAFEMIAEGGAITVDGEGTVITTESCLLNPNRNPGLSKKEVEEQLKCSLGAQTVIWLPGDETEEETNGHVDGLAAFVRPGVVLAERIADRTDPRCRLDEENLKALRAAKDAKGRTLELVIMEGASDVDEVGDRFCLSYVNSYLANGAVIMPSYNVPSDQRVQALYQKLYPDRQVVMVPIDDVAYGGGGIHCIIQQEPLPL